jgi:dTDP-4-amino-4,6-dideoxygalactose transaminase
MDPIVEVARKFNLVVIEDATESLGAKYKERMVGQLADISCFSFNGNKIITTGGGGMILSNNDAWASKAKYLTTQAKDDALEFVHNEVGYNYRLPNIQAAMGCAQMEQLDDYILTKRQIASAYAKSLAPIPGITLMKEAPWAFSTFWMTTILIDEGAYGMNSRVLLKYLTENGVQTRPLWQPMHQSKAHQGAQALGIEAANEIHRAALSLPSSVGLTQAEWSNVIRIINELAYKGSVVV